MVAEPLEKEQQKRLYKIQKTSEEERGNLTGSEIPLPPSFSKPSSASEKVPGFPFVALGGPHVEIVYASFNYSLPVVTSHTPPIKVPFFSLARPLPVCVTQRFHLDVVSLTERKVPLVVPFLNLEKEVKVSVTQDFYIKTAKIRKKMTMLQVPFYHVGQFTAPTVGNNFEMEIYTVPHVLSVPSAVKKDQTGQKILEEALMKETQAVAPALEKAGGGASSVEEIPDFFELVFEGDGGKIRGGGSKVIIFKDLENDSYIDFLEQVLFRVFREVYKRKPEGVRLHVVDPLFKEKIEELLDPSYKIITVNMENLDAIVKDKNILRFTGWEKNERNAITVEISAEKLVERLSEMYAKGPGYLILWTKTNEKYETLEDFLRNLGTMLKGRITIINLKAKKLSPDLVKLASGMLLPEPLAPGTFDHLLNETLFKQDSLFNQALEEIKREEDGLFKRATNRWPDESDLHYNIKVFIVRYLVAKLRKEGKTLKTVKDIENYIQTEVKLNEGVVPDVFYNAENEVYEVETLYDQGSEPDKKIDETIRKYLGEKGINKINIVIDNFGFLLHLRDLASIKRHYSQYLNIEFYTLDLKNKRLVSMDEFIKELRRTIHQSAIAQLDSIGT
jgi:hypothetical protein